MATVTLGAQIPTKKFVSTLEISVGDLCDSLRRDEHHVPVGLRDDVLGDAPE